MAKFKKLVLYDLKPQPLEKEFLQELKEIADSVEIVFAEKEYDGKLKPLHLQGADAFITRLFDNFDKGLFEKSRLRYIGAMHTDFSHFDLGLLKSKGITLCNVPHYATEAVAELSFSVLLNISRQTHDALNFVKQGKWGFQHFMGWELKGKTLGIVGLGAIGSRIAELGLAFGMKVCYYSTERKSEMEKKGIKHCELEELLKNSDVVSLHCNLNNQSKNILNKEMIALLKQGAVLLNPSRNELCDLDAVFEAAKQGKISAWFEDIEDEQLRTKFLGVKNILLTPNYGWMTREAQQNLRSITIENAKLFLEGKPQNRIV